MDNISKLIEVTTALAEIAKTHPAILREFANALDDSGSAKAGPVRSRVREETLDPVQAKRRVVIRRRAGKRGASTTTSAIEAFLMGCSSATSAEIIAALSGNIQTASAQPDRIVKNTLSSLVQKGRVAKLDPGPLGGKTRYKLKEDHEEDMAVNG